MAYEVAKIRSVLSNVIQIDHPIIDGPRTRLTASVAAAGTALTVQDNNGFSNDDPQSLLLLGEVGNEATEVKRVNAAVTAGTALTSQAVTYAHAIDTPVQKVLFDQIQIYGTPTNAFITDNLIATVAIQYDAPYTTYVVTGTTYAFYFIRYRNTLSTTTYNSTESAGVASTGYTSGTVGAVIVNAMQEIGEEGNYEKFPKIWLYHQIDKIQEEVGRSMKRWSWLEVFNSAIGNVVTGDWREATPSDIGDENTNKSMFSARLGREKPMTYVTKDEWNKRTYDVAWTTVRTAGSAAATNLAITNSYDFDSENSVGTNLVGYWKFDENTGSTAYDYTANGYNGTITGATYVTGKSDYALDFDGTDDVVAVTDATNIQNIFDAGGAVSFWINPDSDGENDLGRIIDKGWDIHVASQSGGNVEIILNVPFSGTAGVWSTAVVVPIDSWTHVVISYNADATTNDPTIYINGSSVTVTEDTTPVGTRTTDVGTDLRIGNNSAGSRTFDGTVDEVRLYSGLLTSDEALILYNNPGGGDYSVSVYVGGVKHTVNYTDISFSATTGILFGIPVSGTGSITATLSAGSNVFQDEETGNPTIFTVFDSYVYFYPVISSTNTNRNLFLDYYARPTAITNDATTLLVPDYTLIEYYLEWKMMLRRNSGRSDPDTDYMKKLWMERFTLLQKTERTGQRVKLSPRRRFVESRVRSSEFFIDNSS